LLVAVVGFNDATSSVSTLTDSENNAWLKAGALIHASPLSQAIYYCQNANPGATSLIETFSALVPFVDFRLLEYSGTIISLFWLRSLKVPAPAL
jgi:hypothetical protein